MHELDLLDNDIIFKVSCFDLHEAFARTFASKAPPSRLGVAEFVLRKKISRSRKLNEKSSALERLGICLAWTVALEPTEQEINLAAEIEAIAQQRNISFDSGESLLLAVLFVRAAHFMFTGDKRAIEGLWTLAEALGRQDGVANKVVCFEQILLTVLALIGAEELTQRVCREPGADIAAAICCGCAAGGADAKVIEEGLKSYVSDLRRRAEQVLNGSASYL